MPQVVVYQQDNGIAAILNPTSEALESMTIEEIAAKDVPAGAAWEIIDSSELPADRTFRDAWTKGSGTVTEDLDKSKEIAHSRRRAKREVEFKPYDDIIMKQIPGADTTAAEASRVEIRTKYETMQNSIDSATSTAEIKTALDV